MDVIAGFWRTGAAAEPASAVRRMMTAQAPQASQDARYWGDERFCAGAATFAATPEDRQNEQPSPVGRSDIVLADARLDNREDLLRDLGLDAGQASRASDAALAAMAWARWGEDGLPRLMGDFALAIWRANEQALVLARDPFGQRPLFFARAKGFLAFASMPDALRALPEIPRGVDREAFIGRLAYLPDQGSRSFYRGVSRVEPGTLVRLQADRTQVFAYWRPPRQVVRLRDSREYVEGLRAHMERAVRVRLRRTRGAVASHLSAGFDSSAVTATAARILAETGEPLHAFTAAPRRGYPGPAPAGRLIDEFDLAAQTARAHPNVRHQRVESFDRNPFDEMDRWGKATGQPILGPSNQVWLNAINDQARAAGCSVLLSGMWGNYTISLDGLDLLPDLVREGRLLTWLRLAAALTARREIKPKSLIRHSFGPWFPAWLWKLTGPGRTYGDIRRYSALNPGLEAEVSARARLCRHDLLLRGWRDSIAGRIEDMSASDRGAELKAINMRWGLEERDPTLDQALVEFTLAIPPEAFLQGGRVKALAKLAWSDRLPAAVIENPSLGLQAAEWHEQLTERRPEMEGLLERLSRSSELAEILDLERLQASLDRWPQAGWDDPRVISNYRGAFLSGLAAGDFHLRATGAN